LGSTKAKVAGIGLWLIFAPALISLMPGEMLWRHALPIAGIEGTILAGELMRFVNYPGTMILCGLMVALSLYLTTSFLLANAGTWFTAHFGFLRNLSDRYAEWKSKRRGAQEEEEFDEAFASKREIAAAMARKQESREGEAAAKNGTLLSSFFGWFGRWRRKQEEDDDASIGQASGIERRAGVRLADDAADAGGCSAGDGAACGSSGGGTVCCAAGGGGGSAAEFAHGGAAVHTGGCAVCEGRGR
jgi:hypothetical protein